MYASISALEHILSHEECDVDLRNRLEKATPLHLALKLEDPKERLEVVRSLLDAGADTRYPLYSLALYCLGELIHVQDQGQGGRYCFGSSVPG
jgi:hypothetical protein